MTDINYMQSIKEIVEMENKDSGPQEIVDKGEPEAMRPYEGPFTHTFVVAPKDDLYYRGNVIEIIRSDLNRYPEASIYINHNIDTLDLFIRVSEADYSKELTTINLHELEAKLMPEHWHKLSDERKAKFHSFMKSIITQIKTGKELTRP